ncbi:MAG: hypothetical protein GOMPHAMPRED_006201 [Gomphillus americanus]|uniref:Bromo domain-containing protein n=1 Tax=Gomphillus americanus TaxID=1940652 RepID=A0A8H3ICI9_9LECA|nr:MAG: hypothetical protein GOMPHAMPRED_006201 [Gomphillus americanus]
MATKAPHTLFELSLLLSSLQKYGVDHKSFHRISTEFTQNDTIVEDSTHDTARLTSESLQSLYLQILKSEVRAAQQYTAQQTKRKKSPTPPLQNLDEARKHKHLLPGLTRRYHTEYVKQVLRQIEEDEGSYAELLNEIEILEKQPQDDPPQKAVTNINEARANDGVLKTSNDGKSGNQATPANGQLAKSKSQTISPSVTTNNSSGITPKPPGSGQRIDSPGDGASNHATGAQNPAVSTASASVTDSLNQPSLPNPLAQSPEASSSTSKTQQQQAGSSSSDSLRSLKKQTNNQPRQNVSVIANSLIDNSTPSNFPSISSPGTNPDHGNFTGSLFTPNVKVPWRGQLPPTFTPLPTKLFGNLITPASLNERRRLQGLTPIDTSQSSTKWKDLPRNLTKEGRSPPRPNNSPYLSDSPSPEQESRMTSNFPSIETSRTLDTPTRGRGRGIPRGRGSGARAAGRSADLTAVSARIRSQSAMSAAEDSAPEGVARAPKAEPPATPSFTDEAASFVSATGDSRSNIRRRDLPRDGETPKPNLKRKRVDTMDGTPDISSVPKFSRPGQILASRNFSRIVSALLNDINSHKLASVFAKPITEKSAPGYQDLIYQPQDLKSIRSAISTGSRFVATIPDPEVNNEDAAGGDTSIAMLSASTAKVTNIWVDRTSEVMPPKGIVNSAQLEKELCRMLANAVMYNPDPNRGFGPHFPMTNSRETEEDEAAEIQDRHDLDDGRLVNDAREMFQSIEQAVSAWRAAERIRPGESTNTKSDGGGEKVEKSTEDAAENTGAEDGEGEKSSLRRSTRG